MKVVMLAPANVIHTQRWVEALAARGVDLVLVTQHDRGPWQAPSHVRIVDLPVRGRAGYFLNGKVLRQVLEQEKPDLLNAHYASGYGTLASLSGFHPWLLSVWGSDVYVFPNENPIKGWWLRRILRSSDGIASTSYAMADQVRHLVGDRPNIEITPFGIDTGLFAPKPHPHEGVVIGTVKKLEPIYGIDTLIEAFAKVLKLGTLSQSITLQLVGEGSQRPDLERLCSQLGIEDKVTFCGVVAHGEVPQKLNGFDIYVAASRMESFGVAILEASACALPVIVSDAGGLPEVVEDTVTGLIVKRDDPQSLAVALLKLINDKDLRLKMGQAGRLKVVKQFQWQRSVDQMLDCYARTVATFQ